jgi:hypothetical protein
MNLCMSGSPYACRAGNLVQALYTLSKSGLQQPGSKYDCGRAFICVNPAGLFRAGIPLDENPFLPLFYLDTAEPSPYSATTKKGE